MNEKYLDNMCDMHVHVYADECMYIHLHLFINPRVSTCINAQAHHMLKDVVLKDRLVCLS